MTDMFEELGFGEQRSRWDAERTDDFGDTVVEDEWEEFDPFADEED